MRQYIKILIKSVRFSVLTFCIGFAASTVVGDEPEDKLNSILDLRRSIDHGEIEIESKTYRRDGERKRLESIVIYHCYFDGPQTRVDTNIDRVEPDGTRMRILEEKTIRTTDGSYLHHETSPGVPSIVATIYHADSENPNKVGHQRSIFDPRMLGLSPCPISGMSVFDDWRKIFILKYAKSIKAGREGTIIVKSRPDTEYGDVGTEYMSLDPATGTTPTAVRALQGKDSEMLIEIAAKTVSAGNKSIQFPDSWTYTRRVDGNLSLQNDCKILSLNFVDPIPASVFTIEGLSLENGHIVDVDGGKSPGAKVWEQGELRDYDGEPSLSPPNTRYFGTFSLLLPIVFSITALTFVVWRKMTSTTNS